MSDWTFPGDSETDDSAYRKAKAARNRSEGSEGSLTASDPLSAHSTPNEKFRSDDLDGSEDKDDDDRGVSPPMSHPSMYNQLFGAPAAIQLGLSGRNPVGLERGEGRPGLMFVFCRSRGPSQPGLHREGVGDARHGRPQGDQSAVDCVGVLGLERLHE